MGKISKALEKAERRSVGTPVKRSTPDRLTADRKTAKYASQTTPDGRSGQRQAADPVTRDIGPVKRPVDEKTSVPLDQRATLAHEPSTVVPAEPPIESSPVSSTDANLTRDGANIALVKSKASQPQYSVQGATWGSEAGKSDSQTAADQQSTSGKAVRVAYSKTQVQVNDPEILRNNRIISVFDDMETTDQIRILRTQVLRKLKAVGGNSILVTSANPYEGKTFTSINLGVSIAKEFDRTVLIIDADLRKPTAQHTAFATEFFSLKVDKGLTDFLSGEADISEILINPGIDKLTLIPGGMPVNNAPELLNSAIMQEMMAEVKSRYASDRLVIVDGPAILPFPDAVILSRYVDGVLPVIEAEKTSTEDLKKMMSHLKEVNVLGTVLNKKKG